jgi:integrase
MAEPSPNHRQMTRTPHPGIFRKGNRYVAVWRHRGQQRKRSFRTLTEARRFKARTGAGETAPVSREPFDRYALGWIERYQGRTRRGLADSTRASYRDSIVKNAIPFFGTTRLDAIDPPMVRDFIGSLVDRGLTGASVRRHIAPVRAMFAEAVEDGALRVNPASGVRVIVRGERRTRKPRMLTPEQVRRVLAEIPDEHRDLVLFLSVTGTRISEALAATWADLDREHGAPVFVVRRSKTEAGERTIPLSPEMNRRLLRRRAATGFAASEDPIFPSATGTPIDPRNFRRRVFREACRRAGVDATPHVLRHSLASLLFERGRTSAQVAAWLGHTDPSFTLRTYVHAADLGSADFLDDEFVVGS